MRAHKMGRFVWVVFESYGSGDSIGDFPPAIGIGEVTLTVYRYKATTGYTWGNREGRPPELTELCKAVFDDEVGCGPWRQVIGWISEHLELAPKDFRQAFIDATQHEGQPHA